MDATAITWIAGLVIGALFGFAWGWTAGRAKR